MIQFMPANHSITNMLSLNFIKPSTDLSKKLTGSEPVEVPNCDFHQSSVEVRLSYGVHEHLIPCWIVGIRYCLCPPLALVTAMETITCMKHK